MIAESNIEAEDLNHADSGSRADVVKCTAADCTPRVLRHLPWAQAAKFRKLHKLGLASNPLPVHPDACEGRSDGCFMRMGACLKDGSGADWRHGINDTFRLRSNLAWY